MNPRIKRTLQRLQEINAESTRSGQILAAKNHMLEAMLSTGDVKEIEAARQELLAAFEASVDLKIRVNREADQLQNEIND